MANSYVPPSSLQDLHILDFLELAGTQAKAGAALAMHQSTVCRSLQLMRDQFRLVPHQGTSVCRYGHNDCLQYLRLAYRAHRVMEGMLRIGTDLLHQGLLAGMPGVQLVPPRFRRGELWADLVRYGLLDGAIVSSFCLEKFPLSSQGPQWEGTTAVPLGRLALQLVARTSTARQVLLPRKGAMPLLHQTMERLGFVVEQLPAACQETAAWLKRARDRSLALPICLELLQPGWQEAKGLVPLAEPPALLEQLWLLLPQAAQSSTAAQQCLKLLARRMEDGRNMQDPHGRLC